MAPTPQAPGGGVGGAFKKNTSKSAAAEKVHGSYE